MELIISLSYTTFLLDAGVDTSLIKNISSSTPSASKLHELLQECATDSMYEVCEEILSNGCKIFLTADKGAMKGSHTHFVKIISWYSTKSKRIKTFCLDTDDSDGSSSDCANAIRHALIKIFGRDNVDFILQGQMTDSGGGGTGLSFHRTLQNQGITTNDANYLVGYCTLHCIQLTLSTPVKHVIGEGGTDNSGQYRQNTMQLLHEIYNLQSITKEKSGKLFGARRRYCLIAQPAVMDQ